MAFQFHCPQGHLLSAHEYQAGQQTHCPMCGMALIIPLPTVMAPPTPTVMFPYSPVGGPPPAPPEMSSLPPAAEPEAPVTDRFSALAAAAKAAEAEAADAEKPPEPAAEAPPVEPAVLHIPCPKGHVLETPEDMLDQEVLCPHCQAQFVLRRRNSVEFRQKKEEEERIREFKTGKFWLNMAIVVVVLVVLGLVALIVVRNLMHTPVSNQNRSAQLVREAASTLARHAARRHRHPTAVQPLISGGHSSLLKNEIASIRQPG